MIGRNPFFKQAKYSTIYKIKASDGKAYKTRLFNSKGIVTICSLSKYGDSAKAIIDYINQETGNDYVIVDTRKETQFFDKLEEFLKYFNIDIIRQFRVFEYRLDCYIPKLNIAIEYDEDYHKYYDKKNDLKRQRVIRKELKCSLIRLNSNKSDMFNLAHVISNIEQFDNFN